MPFPNKCYFVRFVLAKTYVACLLLVDLLLLRIKYITYGKSVVLNDNTSACCPLLVSDKRMGQAIWHAFAKCTGKNGWQNLGQFLSCFVDTTCPIPLAYFNRISGCADRAFFSN